MEKDANFMLSEVVNAVNARIICFQKQSTENCRFWHWFSAVLIK